MDAFLAAFETALQPQYLLILAAAVCVGLITGSVPGLTVTMAIALAVPLTVWMGAVPSMMLLLGLYASGIYGGSISGCLINVPGTPANAATSLDGFPLAQQGKALKALKMALYASTYGALFSIGLLILVAPQLAGLALKFGPAEITCLLLFALTVVATLAGDALLKGLLSAAIGMLLATVGADPMLSIPRFTFGRDELFDGIAYIPLLIGLFAIAELLTQAEQGFRSQKAAVDLKEATRDDNHISAAEWKRCAIPMVRSGVLGSFIGMLPGLGAAVAAFIGYAETKRTSKQPERFGKGAIEGVAAAESANSAVTGSAMIPMLALSIPGDPPTAILLGALMIQGVTTGPLIFQTNPDIVYSIYVVLFLAILFTFIIGRLALRPIAQVLKVPKVLLFPVILVLCVAGSYATNNSLFDVYVMIAAGILGYGLRLFAVPVAPLLIAFILTRPLEEAMRQALILSEGNFMIFVSRPFALAFLVLGMLLVGMTALRHFKHSRKPIDQS